MPLGRDAPARLGDAVRRLAQGRPQAVRARILAAPAAAWRDALLRLGLDPDRIEVLPAAASANEVQLTRFVAQGPDCSAAPGADDPGLDDLGRCAQAANLAAMLVDPGDLIAGPALEPADGERAADAVARWRGQGGAGQVGGGQGGGPPPPAAAPGGPSPDAAPPS